MLPLYVKWRLGSRICCQRGNPYLIRRDVQGRYAFPLTVDIKHLSINSRNKSFEPRIAQRRAFLLLCALCVLCGSNSRPATFRHARVNGNRELIKRQFPSAFPRRTWERAAGFIFCLRTIRLPSEPQPCGSLRARWTTSLSPKPNRIL